MRRIERYFRETLYPCPVIKEQHYPLMPIEFMYAMESNFAGQQDKIVIYPFLRNWSHKGTRFIDIYVYDIMGKQGYERFIIKENEVMEDEREELFRDYCLNNNACFEENLMKILFSKCEEEYPKIHLRPYRNKGLILLHLYYCLHRNGPREILFKANLGFLASYIERIPACNFIGTSPADIFVISPKYLRYFNCKIGVESLSGEDDLEYVKQVCLKFQDIFQKCGLNNKYQWKYLCNCYDNGIKPHSRIYDFIISLDEKEYTDYKTYVEQVEAIRDYYNLPTVPPPHLYAEYSYKAAGIFRMMLEEELLDRYIEAHAYKRKALEYESDKYKITLLHSVRELCHESENQNNCLWRYVYGYAWGTTTILTLRKKENSDKAYITMEVVNNRIVQALKKNNKPVEQEDLEFINRYAAAKRLEVMIHQ